MYKSMLNTTIKMTIKIIITNEHIGICQFVTHQNFPSPDLPKFSTVKILRHTVFTMHCVPLTNENSTSESEHLDSKNNSAGSMQQFAALYFSLDRRIFGRENIRRADGT